MLPTLTALLILISATPSAVAQLWHDPFSGTLLATRTQTVSSPHRNCSAACSALQAMIKTCAGPPCGCNDPFFNAAGDCLVCEARTPEDMAWVQIDLDGGKDQCHDDGILVHFQLHLPPNVQEIVDEFNRKSASFRQQQRSFLGLHIAGGHVGMSIVLALAILSRKVRDLTFLNFCITWILSSVIYSILLYRGTEGHTLVSQFINVSPTTCVTQAALINGAQVMTACSTTALVIQLWIRLRTAIYGDLASGMQKRWKMLVLIASPYLFFLGFAIPSIFVGKVHIMLSRISVQRALAGNFYCSIMEVSPFLRAIYGVTLGLLTIAAIFDALIIVILYRHCIYRVIVAVAYGTMLDRPPEISRVGSENVILISFRVPIWVDLLQAAIPLVAFIVFGLNFDMLGALVFWHRNGRAFPTTHRINITPSRGIPAVDTNGNTVDIRNGTWGEKASPNVDTTHVGVSDKV